MQDRFEQYIEEIGVRLKSLPEEERSRELEEIRQHLESLADAGRARGLSESEAASDAIRRFDSARSVARDLNYARLRGRLRSLPEIVRVALYTWAIGFVVTLIDKAAIYGLDTSLFGSYRVAPISVQFPPHILWLGGLSLVALPFALGGREALREMRSLSTPWGAAARWSLVRAAITSPFLIGDLAYQYLHLAPGIKVPPYTTLLQYLWLIPSALIAFLVARAAPGKAYRGIVIAAALEPALLIITLLAQLIRYYATFTAPVAMTVLLGSVLWYAVSAAAPMAGAVIGGRWRRSVA